MDIRQKKKEQHYPFLSLRKLKIGRRRHSDAARHAPATLDGRHDEENEQAPHDKILFTHYMLVITLSLLSSSLLLISFFF